MVEKENAEKLQDLEQQVFEALENQKRRDILRIIGENKGIAYTKILNASKVADSPTLSYHLKSLAPFIEQKEGKYRLTTIGKDAYNLLLKTHAYDKLALLQKNKFGVILGNGVIWLGAIAAAVYLGTDVFLSTVVLPILAAMSLVITYGLFE
jgi:DNA-binding transcriptional ArsR family regulator